MNNEDRKVVLESILSYRIPQYIKLNTNNTRKIKNKILAIPAAPAATPPKPNIAAIMAITRKITVQRNITFSFKLDNRYS